MSNIDKRALREAAERATESDWIVDAHEGWHAVIPVADAVNGNYIIAEFRGRNQSAIVILLPQPTPPSCWRCWMSWKPQMR